MKKRKLGLTSKILLALVIGIVIGIILYSLPDAKWKDDFLVGGVLYVLGTMFINALKMLLVPVVFFSLAVGVSSLSDIKQLGRIGSKTLIYYLSTTAIAISLALLVGLTLNPGKNVDLGAVQEGEVSVNEAAPFSDILINIVPSNPIEALASGNMLQIIFFAIMFGVTMTLLQEKVPTIKKLTLELNDLFLKMVGIIMLVAPIGVFALITRTFAMLGYDAIWPLLKYLGSVLIGLFFMLIVYVILLRIFGKVNPFVFFKKIVPPMSIGFSTASSAAALPIFLRTAEESLGVDKKVSSFTLPLGSTINMDGTAIMQGVATIFIAQVYGAHLTPSDYIIVILTATLASIGTASMPGAGIIMLSLVLTSVNLPVEGIALIIGIDRIVDMFRTSVNLCGDAVGTIIVANSEGALDEAVYNDPTKVIR